MEKIINLNGKDIKLNFDELDNLALEEILTIDYTKIEEEAAIFPFIVNQINFLLIEASDAVRKEEFQLECVQSNLDEYKANSFLKVKKELQEKGEKNPTISLIESQIALQEGYKNLKESIRGQKIKIAEVTKNRDLLNGLYWSASSKMKLLINLSNSISKENV